MNSKKDIKRIISENSPDSEWRDFLAEFQAHACPTDTRMVRVIGGWIVPAMLALIAHPYFFGKAVAWRGQDYLIRGPMVLTGTPAVAFGTALLSLGAFLHFHCFWPYRNEWVCALGKLISLTALLSAMGVFIWGMIAS